MAIYLSLFYVYIYNIILHKNISMKSLFVYIFNFMQVQQRDWSLDNNKHNDFQ